MTFVYKNCNYESWMDFFTDTNLVTLTCYDATNYRSQLLLIFIPTHYVVPQFKFTAFKHHIGFVQDCIGQLAVHGTIISTNSWYPGLRWVMPDPRHFCNPALTTAVKILRQKYPNEPCEIIFGAKFCKSYIYICNHRNRWSLCMSRSNFLYFFFALCIVRIIKLLCSTWYS